MSNLSEMSHLRRPISSSLFYCGKEVLDHCWFSVCVAACGSYSSTFDEREILIDLKWYTLVTKCMNKGSPPGRFC